ncbi:M48 family metallopeptidase [Paludibacterium yongneupense]|uniref:M48 family metallopeptidase n=1 Tax=Paludibacterium yongneupense TaxID=400061 RepID=UPI00042679DE|nr:M48 family metallopeptidase [Paludibacterium yongneupense]
MHLKYLTGYPEQLQEQAQQWIASGRLNALLQRRYDEYHEVGDDRALYAYALQLKNRYLRKAPPLSLVVFDSRINQVQHALGLNSSISRPHGSRLKSRNEIRIASLFKKAPAAFLRMIVVHELAHLKEKEHDRAFYLLCRHMEPDYFQLEFDLRLYLTLLEMKTGQDASDD